MIGFQTTNEGKQGAFNAKGTVYLYEYKDGLPEIGYLTFKSTPDDATIEVEGEIYGHHFETTLEEWLNPRVDISNLGM